MQNTGACNHQPAKCNTKSVTGTSSSPSEHLGSTTWDPPASNPSQLFKPHYCAGLQSNWPPVLTFDTSSCVGVGAPAFPLIEEHGAFQPGTLIRGS